MSKNNHDKITRRIFWGMILGAGIGIVLHSFRDVPWVKTWLLSGIFDVGGRIFLASLKLMVVPVVFFSLAVGVANIGDLKRLGSIGSKTLGLYLATTAAAVTLALLIALLIHPGQGLSLAQGTTFNAPKIPPLTETLVQMFPTNPVQAFAEANMIQVIVFSLLFGFALLRAGAAGRRVLSTLSDFNDAVLQMIVLLLVFAPIGVFCLITRVFAEHGFDAILPMAKYFFTVLGVLALQLFGVYSLLLKFLAKLSPIEFFRRFKEVLLVAFSTSSSNATLPVTMEVTEKELKVDNAIASFTLPLGATINMDGTAIMQGVATVLIADSYGIAIGLPQILTVILMATIASIGTAGVPGVGLVTLTLVLQQVGLPIEGIALVLGVDRFLDMSRTCVNVTGDAIITCIVAKSEKAIGSWS